MTTSEDVLTIDPVAMNVVNRIAYGTVLQGDVSFEGGVLVQGQLGGEVHVKGRVIVWQGGLLKGRVRVFGDMYIFGQLGEPGAGPDGTQVECMGTLYLANTGVSTASVTARHLMMYEGADLQGPFMTLRPGKSLPVLGERIPSAQAAPPQWNGVPTGNI
ncbi:polymer-forming cytoskeletal protein [Caenimonas koreensis]|uniref:bactofilin family protein n=1 Tax=Caenimonas koreensis TaxID=367474 RepID=UPI0037840101